MGDKVDGLLQIQERTKATDPVAPVLDALIDFLHLEVTTGDLFEASDEVQHLKNIKPLMERMAEAVNEQLKLRLEILHGEMLEAEMQNFARKGKTFYLTTESYVTARKELGGTSNPDLIEWLKDEDMGEIAKMNVNANTLRSNVNTWRDQHPIQAVVDGEELEGDLLLEHLGLTLEEFEERVASHDRLLELVEINSVPTVGMRKA